MSDLRSFAALQARVFEFLEQQDETTLRAIADGTAQLAVAVAGGAPARAKSAPSNDPVAAWQDLSRLESKQERRTYLAATKLTVNDLKKIAKLWDLTGYSKFARAGLIDLLAAHGLDQSDTDEPALGAEQPVASAAIPSPEAAAIAARLREIDTEEEGAAYLRDQHLDHAGLLVVAAELQLTRVDRLRPSELEKRVLKQAIGAHRKFAGLRKW